MTQPKQEFYRVAYILGVDNLGVLEIERCARSISSGCDRLEHPRSISSEIERAHPQEPPKKKSWGGIFILLTNYKKNFSKKKSFSYGKFLGLRKIFHVFCKQIFFSKKNFEFFLKK